MKLKEIFFQEGNILKIRYCDTVVTFKMPEYFKIQEVSNDLKILSLILLFYPIDKSLFNYNFTRKRTGNRIGLAYSGGVDSTAAWCLLPKNRTIPFYFQREIIKPTQFRHDNALLAIEKLPSEVLILQSDMDQVRVKTGQAAGFLNDQSFFGGFVLLADYLKIGYLSSGAMLESTYLKKGYEFRDFHNDPYFERWFGLFERAGLPLFYPCMTCSEILTSKIVSQSGLYAQSCVRGTGGEGCNRCYKCFRKKLINGELLKYDQNGEVYRVLKTRPLKQGASLIYAMDRAGVDIPELREYKDLNLNWLENYFEYTLLSIPAEWREYLRGELNKYSSLADDNILKSFRL